MKKWIVGLAVLLLAGPAWGADAKAATGKSFEVPYRLSETNHIIVRAKLNGKGPYNFILDTGAPALYVATTVSKKVNVEADKEGWGTFDRVELEGGVVLDKAKGRIADPYQLKGMNTMGLAGIELHGVLGYNLLARYKITLDVTRDKMTFTALDFDPPAPEPLDKKGVDDGVDAMGAIVEIASRILGKRGVTAAQPRGFLGVELEEKDGAVVVKSMIEKGPAAEAGLKPGDRILRVAGEKVKDADAVRALVAKVTDGDKVELTVQRGDDKKELTVKAGRGF